MSKTNTQFTKDDLGIILACMNAAQIKGESVEMFLETKNKVNAKFNEEKIETKIETKTEE